MKNSIVTMFLKIRKIFSYNPRVKVFISHDADKDRDYGELIRDLLILNFDNILSEDIFLSSRPKSGVKPGSPWFNGIVNALAKSKVILALITEESKKNIWIHLESGAVLEKEKTIAIFYEANLNRETPLGNLQGHFLHEESIFHLLDILKGKGANPKSSWQGVEDFLEQNKALLDKKRQERKVSNNKLTQFAEYLEKSKWKPVNNEKGEFYICDTDESFHIKICSREEEDKFDTPEEWIEKIRYHTPSYKIFVQLLVNNVEIEDRIMFVSMDESKIFVPAPDFESEHPHIDERLYYYKTDSISYRLCKRIGRYGSYNTIEEFADSCDIKIIDSENELGEILKKERPLRIRDDSTIKFIEEYRDNRHHFKIHFYLMLLNVSDEPISLKGLDIVIKAKVSHALEEQLRFSLDEYAVQKEREQKYLQIKNVPLTLEPNKMTQVWFLCPGGGDSKEKIDRIKSSNYRLFLTFHGGRDKKHNFFLMK